MADMPDNYIDLAVVDPPYKDDTEGLNLGVNRNFEYKHFNAPDEKYISELFRVSKNQILWGFNYYLKLLKNTDSIIFWNKHQNGHFSEGELAWCSLGKTRYYDRAYQKDIGNKIHPTQKPVALYRWILQNYAKPNDLILDTHSGSGSLACACHLEKYDFIAIEKDVDYHKDSVKRLDKLRAQGVLF